jgi:hypothetical protein
MKTEDYIEILKILLGWPFITMIIVLLIRKEMPPIINKLTKAKFGGTEFEFKPEPPPEKINEIKKEFEKIVSIKDPKLLDVASKFEYWLKNYNHYGASHSESFRNFITNDKALVNYGVTYDEYKTLAEILKQKGMEIEYIIPEKAYN